MNLQLAGKKALITGGCEGIGKAVARQLAQEGVDCVISSSNATTLKETARELFTVTGSHLYPVPGSKIYPVAADLRDPDSILSLVERAAELLGGIDILVNYGSDGELEDFEDQVRSYSRCIQSVVPYMKKNNWGRIINVNAPTTQSVESISADEQVELAKYGITVNAVYTGVEEAKTTNSIGQLAKPEEIANVITFLSSPLSVAITGEAINVSGGLNKKVQYQNNL
ncbi:SDR family NAD(P)-dependent oxidoreductase [Ureibacillus manganicus]|uniref:Short-chain dehydrogenase n=1 Tax=Ureibacillus manganicus DSM 26584 TaxID=1384049 RepID=A0A0A3I2N6_9BACL|nr:SDR family NAD(P)-dependent oxidoreductase [Ureibacillus manganicus]KGR78979.1 hypothetical protein CD29_08155 [Ureibacillus manganicus DSM 26584]